MGGNVRGTLIELYWDNGKSNGNYCLGFRGCARVLHLFTLNPKP